MIIGVVPPPLLGNIQFHLTVNNERWCLTEKATDVTCNNLIIPDEVHLMDMHVKQREVKNKDEIQLCRWRGPDKVKEGVNETKRSRHRNTVNNDTDVIINCVYLEL